MGFILKADLETNLGPSQEIYARIEGMSYNKGTNLAMFQVTYWVNKDHASKFNRTFLDEPFKNMIGLIQDRVIFYSDEHKEGVELILPQYIETHTVVEKEVEVPLYETKLTKKEVPYTSFDEEGEEITLYRTVHVEEQVQVGVEKEIKQVIDSSIAGRLLEFCYETLKQELGKQFPIDNIETVK